MYHMVRQILQKTLLLAVLAATLVWPARVQASELLMFERAGCVWCQRWDREIGPVYDKTAEAKLLPLRRINAESQAARGITLASPVHYTPTFVVVNNGREIGRITGYVNDDTFWGLPAALATRITPPDLSANRI
ncbi:thioredoxin family protein [Bradyrhizobium sp. AUGA SZCCT0283]|uniref:thioredoxin family protein n=1 Tax=Bradyrhizobium sp. AUGA SZCCT0283 TaxID=2807671 RepID=UPI001BAB7D25|nr:thioredoxin family protein [Bradyrhizobium sp. AUGA SZCCT0283]MBR1273772.1 thioredoxin family protein [Bradyrhizobium sp. AUGA SZCCT0283]